MTGRVFHDWLVANTGIEARCWMRPDQVGSDLGLIAALAALEQAQIDAADVDLLIVATDTPDQPSPATSAVLQHKLGAHRAGVFDVNSACAGFVTALDLAARLIATDRRLQRVLVVGIYGMSRFLDLADKATSTLFADGAGAVLLGAAPAGAAPGYLAGARFADGQYHDALGIFGGGTARPSTSEALAAHGAPRVEFARKLPATFNLERWPALVREVLDEAGADVDDVALFVFTQLNKRTIEAVMGALGQPMDRAHTIMERWGYTGSACVPMALDDAARRGRLKVGDLVVLCASGGGVSMAAAALRWTAPPPADRPA
ncbi:MAG: ketoacyl-ACP synthase III [Deltaproteobacteria bacterium]|nr:ketoacyl-ACP synthase III [Deltaproteobacteria bacterium]